MHPGQDSVWPQAGASAGAKLHSALQGCPAAGVKVTANGAGAGYRDTTGHKGDGNCQGPGAAGLSEAQCCGQGAMWTGTARPRGVGHLTSVGGCPCPRLSWVWDAKAHPFPLVGDGAGGPVSIVTRSHFPITVRMQMLSARLSLPRPALAGGAGPASLRGGGVLPRLLWSQSHPTMGRAPVCRVGVQGCAVPAAASVPQS